jgi:MtN3 and saliva related transmembrane protein
MIDSTEMLGLVAACLTTSAFVPQVVQTMRTKDVSGISLPMYIVLCSGICLWLVYGLLNQQISVIAANAITLMLALVVLVLKLKYKDITQPAKVQEEV